MSKPAQKYQPITEPGNTTFNGIDKSGSSISTDLKNPTGGIDGASSETNDGGVNGYNDPMVAQSAFGMTTVPMNDGAHQSSFIGKYFITDLKYHIPKSNRKQTMKYDHQDNMSLH